MTGIWYVPVTLYDHFELTYTPPFAPLPEPAPTTTSEPSQLEQPNVTRSRVGLTNPDELTYCFQSCSVTLARIIQRFDSRFVPKRSSDL